MGHSMPPEPWRYKSVTIVGLGLIGGSLALALRRAGYPGAIRAVSSAATVEEALRQRTIDAGCDYSELPRAAADSDLVVLASPIRRIIEHLEALGAAPGALRPGTTVSDVGSTKKTILETAVRVLPPGVSFIGGHPMAGSERRGFAAADPFLFQNAYYVLTPAPGVPGAAVAGLEAFLATTGARLLVLGAEQHDRAAALISHLPQVLAVTLVGALERHADSFDLAIRLAAGGFRDMTRIASSPFAMWRDILETNSGPLKEALGRLIGDLQAVRERIGSESIEATFENAARTRAAIPRDSKGFMRPLWEVLVVVEDRPGVILAISGKLAEKKINIKDIEVVKVREDEGGTLRLAFSSQEIAKEAVGLLKAAGFQARIRD
jgi:prephenate dehydrogenase